MKVRMIIDSTTDLMPEDLEQLTVVPLTIRFGDREYVHGKDITNTEFYGKLVSSDVLPTTSQPTPAVFEDVFREAVEAGEDVVCVTISAKLSGTYQSASMAAAEFPGHVFVVDSNTVTVAAGILVQCGLQLIAQGKTAEQVAKELEIQKEKVHLIAIVDTLEYLKKGGRISKTVAFAGGLLSIKPLICVSEGEVKMLGTARGNKQGNSLINKEVDSRGIDPERPVMLGYTGTTDELLQKYIAQSADYWAGKGVNPPVSIVGSVVGTHAGPGAVAVAFFEK